jgi:nucleoside-diphosphate-sugar epimerase
VRALVTGAAGFIGTHLVDHLLDTGWDVLGVDAREPAPAPRHRAFRMVRSDLVTADAQSLDELCRGVDVVFHLAGQPGVRSSWSGGFARCARDNIDATQRLLDAARHHPIDRFVFASSSSVYGNAVGRHVDEDDPAVPHSPYGVTKLAAELLCRAYAANFDVPAVNLRYFTVYGPGQRPDMSIHRMIRAALGKQPFHLYGDGSQTREFTFVTDVVRATAMAATASGGATIAPRATAAANGTGSSRHTTAATAKVVASTSPTESRVIETFFGLNSSSEVLIEAVYSSGGSRPSSTHSGSISICGTNGR